MNAQTKTAAKTAEPTTEPEAAIVRHPETAKPGNLVLASDTPTPTVFGRPVLVAIAKIMREVGSVKKDGYNEFHRYNYTSAAAIADALQSLMGENGLVIIQRERDVQYMEAMGTLAIKYDFDVQHASGDRLDEQVRHTGMSAAKNSKGGFDDKAGNKCHTAARKYFLLGLFNIPSGDFPDADAHEDQPAEKPRPQAQQAKAEPPKDRPAQQQTQLKPADQKQDHPFALITGDGVELTYSNGTEYLAGMERAFQEAADKVGFWDSNKVHFDGWMFKLIKVGNNKKAIDEFSRVSKEITDTVFLLTSQKGA